MAEPRGCIKVEVDESKYSSFVPVIGMYVAVASLVCFLGMFYDICSAFRHKKRWLPCRLFSLNSLTLVLLAIAAKLPVDLTTPMPSGLDQFSKLAGNSLVCISMGFFMPSLGLRKYPDSLTNMLAVSLFVATLVINTCIQIRTGVIFFFITEHIILMCCLLAMLYPLWDCFGIMVRAKDFALDHNKDLVREGKGSLLQRLELAYLYGFNHDPQFVIVSSEYENHSVSGLCIICSVVLMQSALRKLSFKFCGGSSDYGWSIWVIVLTQILVVLLGSCATIFRSWGFCDDEKMVGNDKKKEPSWVNIAMYDSMMWMEQKCGLVLTLVLMWVNPITITVLALALLIFFVSYLTSLLFFIAKRTCAMVFTCLDSKEGIGDVEHYKNLIIDGGGMSLKEWGLLESVKDMKRWMEMCKSRSMKNLADLLLNTQPSQAFHMMKAPQIFLIRDTIEVSLSSLVQLVYIAGYSLPPDQSGSLIQAFREVFEIIYFVDAKMRGNSSTVKREIKEAKAYWVYLSNYRRSWQPEESLFDLSLAEAKQNLGVDETDSAGRKRLAIIELIENGASDFIQQLFVDMVHIFLTQLPRALYKEVTQSTAEGFYQSVKTSLEILWKIESLETLMRSEEEAPSIKWSFPEECNICDLTSDPSHHDNGSPQLDGNVIVKGEE